MSVSIYKLDIPMVDLRIADIEPVVEAIRAVAYPQVNTGSIMGLKELPTSITAYFTVGEADGIPDMWDLRDTVAELEANIGTYMDIHLGKPQLAAPDEVSDESHRLV